MKGRHRRRNIISWFLFEPPTARTRSNCTFFYTKVYATKSKTGPLSKQVIVSGLVSSFYRTRHTCFFGVRMSLPASGESMVRSSLRERPPDSLIARLECDRFSSGTNRQVDGRARVLLYVYNKNRKRIAFIQGPGDNWRGVVGATEDVVLQTTPKRRPNTIITTVGIDYVFCTQVET